MVKRAQKSKVKRPWNAGKSVGAKKPLDPDSLNSLRRVLKAKGKVGDLALLETAVSTMLRGSDVLRLTVSDVRGNSGIIVELPRRSRLGQIPRQAKGLAWLSK
jgi:integrase